MSNVHVKYVCRMHNTIDDYKRITLGNPTNDLYKVHKLLYAKHVMVENLMGFDSLVFFWRGIGDYQASTLYNCIPILQDV